MLKNKLFINLLIILGILYFNQSYSADITAKTIIKAKPNSKNSQAQETKGQPKNEIQEDQKYAIAYDKCIKEAEVSEATYDRVFNKCMEKNGFPQEEYSSGSDIEMKEGQEE